MALRDEVLAGGEVGEWGSRYVLGLGCEKLSIDRERERVPGVLVDKLLLHREVRYFVGLSDGGVTGWRYTSGEVPWTGNLRSSVGMPCSSR